MKRRVKKLTLNRETVRRLTDDELKGVAGGDPTNGNTCNCPTAVDCPTDGGCTCRPNTAPCCLSCPGTICE